MSYVLNVRPTSVWTKVCLLFPFYHFEFGRLSFDIGSFPRFTSLVKTTAKSMSYMRQIRKYKVPQCPSVLVSIFPGIENRGMLLTNHL